MLSRRQIYPLIFVPTLTGLAGCQPPAGGGTPGTVAPPSLDQVKALLNALSPELPTFVAELQASKTITPAQAAQASQYIDQLQVLLTQLDQAAPSSDPQTLLNQIGMLLATVMSFIPQAAPFIPLVITVQAVITAYLASRPVTAPGGTPVPTPPPPAPATLQGMHAQTRTFRH